MRPSLKLILWNTALFSWYVKIIFVYFPSSHPLIVKFRPEQEASSPLQDFGAKLVFECALYHRIEVLVDTCINHVSVLFLLYGSSAINIGYVIKSPDMLVCSRYYSISLLYTSILKHN